MDEPWNENDGRKEILMHEQMNDTSIAWNDFNEETRCICQTHKYHLSRISCFEMVSGTKRIQGKNDKRTSQDVSI